jgi:hypothetical protein
MAWTNVPPATDVDIVAYAWAIQFWKAARERAQAAAGLGTANGFWPRTNHDWTGPGSIATLVDNHDGTHTLTDTNSTYLPAVNNRWFSYTDLSAPWIPAFYDCVFDDLDETKVARSPILGSTISGTTGTLTLDTASLQAFVDSKQIPSISSLAGKSYYIIARGGLWWNERWPEWPNDWEYWLGTETSSTLIDMTDTAAKWSAHQWQPAGGISYELMIGGKRIAITDNTPTTLSFAAQASAPTGAYAIVKTGARWRNKKSGMPFMWYGGAKKEFYSHYPDDTLQATQEPATSVTLRSNPPDCDMTFSAFLFDQDFWTDLDDTCNTPDQSYCPDLFKTYRGVQLFIEGVCQAFVDKNLTYDNATSIPTFRPATFFKAAGINSYTTTVTALAGDGITIPTQTFPYTPIPVYFAVLDASGNVQNYGTGIAATTTHITAGFSAMDVGLTLVLSLGWTRYYPREFRYLYDKECFIPGISTGAMGDPPAGQIVDPPTTATPGLWKFRPKSTTYKTHSLTGFVQEGADAFVADDAARYSGDNWNDPTINNPATIAVGDDATLLSYFDNFYTGWHDPTHKALDAMPSGKSTGGSHTQLQDTGAAWWANVMLATTGTADSGSTTSLGDSTKGTDGRWNPATGRWVGFVVEVQISGTWYRRPITGFTGTTITWTEALPGSANGKAYQIREPGAGNSSTVGYELNRYAGRTLTVTDPAPGGATTEITITNSDDTTLYFATQAFTIGVNWPYSISEAKPGGVWQWYAPLSTWIAPTGPDFARGTTLWHTNQTENLPTKHKDYGRMNKGDYFGPHITQELYNAFKQLVWTTANITWDPERIDGTPENNQETALDTAEGMSPYSSAESYYAFAWANAPDGPTSVPGSPSNFYRGNVGSAAGPPLAYATCGRFPTIGGGAYGDTLQGDRIYAYAVAAGIPTQMQSSIEYYVFGTIDEFDHAPGTDYTFDANGDTIAYHHWRKYDSASSSNTASRKSIAFGTGLAKPNPPAEPAADGESTFNGYYVGNALAILKWDDAGGMVFI